MPKIYIDAALGKISSVATASWKVLINTCECGNGKTDDETASCIDEL